MRGTLAVLLAAGIGATFCGVSLAQNVQPAPPGEAHPHVAPPSTPSPPPEKVAPGALNTHPSLSDKLASQNGTLQPPTGVDPGMPVKRPPKTGSMPVIPPPGSSGSKSRVVPK